MNKKHVVARQKIVELKVKIPQELIKGIDFLVEAGIYPNRNEAIRDAMRNNLRDL